MCLRGVESETLRPSGYVRSSHTWSPAPGDEPIWLESPPGSELWVQSLLRGRAGWGSGQAPSWPRAAWPTASLSPAKPRAQASGQVLRTSPLNGVRGQRWGPRIQDRSEAGLAFLLPWICPRFRCVLGTVETLIVSSSQCRSRKQASECSSLFF